MVKSNKTRGTLHEYPSTFYNVDSDMCRPTKIQRKNHCYLSMAALSILYDFDSGICSSAVKKELIDAFPWQKWLRERARMLRCKYTLILFSYDIV